MTILNASHLKKVLRKGRKSCQGAGWCERVRRERTVYGGYRHIRQR